MNEELQQTVDESSQALKSPARRYKFMTNVLVRAQDKETYVKLLKKVTKDAMVPTLRIIVAGVMIIVSLIAAAWLISSDLDRAGFIAIPTLMFVLAIIWIAYYVTISSRKKSMLASAINLLMMHLTENLRMKSAKYGELRTLGIKSFKNGFILFEDGDYGACFAYAGQLGKATLPEVANQVQQIRFDYLVSRSDTSHEMTITSIKQLNVDAQVDYYKTVHNVNEGNSVVEAWCRYMAKMMKEEVEDKIAKNEVSIYQYLIIREKDAKDLTKSIDLLHFAAADGMYSSLRKIDTAEEFLTSVGAISMISRKGKSFYVKKDEEEQKQKRFKRQ